jgi:hypothetical protein
MLLLLLLSMLVQRWGLVRDGRRLLFLLRRGLVRGRCQLLLRPRLWVGAADDGAAERDGSAGPVAEEEEEVSTHP